MSYLRVLKQPSGPTRPDGPCRDPPAFATNRRRHSQQPSLLGAKNYEQAHISTLGRGTMLCSVRTHGGASQCPTRPYVDASQRVRGPRHATDRKCPISGTIPPRIARISIRAFWTKRSDRHWRTDCRRHSSFGGCAIRPPSRARERLAALRPAISVVRAGYRHVHGLRWPASRLPVSELRHHAAGLVSAGGSPTTKNTYKDFTK